MMTKDYRALPITLDNGGRILARRAKQKEFNLEVIERKWVRYAVFETLICFRGR